VRLVPLGASQKPLPLEAGEIGLDGSGVLTHPLCDRVLGRMRIIADEPTVADDLQKHIHFLWRKPQSGLAPQKNGRHDSVTRSMIACDHTLVLGLCALRLLWLTGSSS
jgi:hypothetical protein